MKKLSLVLLFLLGASLPAVAEEKILSKEELAQILEVGAQPEISADGIPYTGVVRRRMSFGFISIPYVDGFVTGRLVIEYDNGEKLFNDLNKGLDNGEFRIYYPDGTLKMECDYRDDKCITPEREYYESGKLKIEKECVNGQFNGFIKKYYENGQVEQDVQQKDGKLNGKSHRYDENGILLSEVEYVDGLRQGIARIYYPNGKVQAEITIVDGKENGPVKEYYENGQLHKDYAMVDGRPEGKVKEYYESGRLYAKSVFKDGMSHNAKFYFDETPAKVLYSAIGGISFFLGFILTFSLLKWRLKRKQNK